jgi:hypothetical protein
MVGLSLWKEILANQIQNLNSLPEVKVTNQEFVDSFPSWNLGYGRTWSTPGYQRILMELSCCAVMDCNPRNLDTDYVMTQQESKKIVTKSKHTLEIMFPRGYPNDEVFWGVFFHGEAPMYPNIAKVDANGLNVFNRGPPLGGPYPGTLCMGIDEASNDISAIVRSLISYLKFADEGQHRLVGQGGRNDGGFDHDLANHVLSNFDVLKQAIATCSKGGNRIDFTRKRIIF